MNTVNKCVDEIIKGMALQTACRKYAKNSAYSVRQLTKIVRWMLTPEWLKARVGNYKGNVGRRGKQVVWGNYGVGKNNY